MMWRYTRRIVLLVILIYRIGIIYGMPDNATLTRTTNSNSASDTSTHSMILLAEHFAVLWNAVNDAILQFTLEYQSRHHVIVITDYSLLEKAEPYEMGVGKIHGVLRLKFLKWKNDQHSIQSSIFLKVPRFGVLYATGLQLQQHHKEAFMYEHILPLIQNAAQPASQEYFSPNFYGTTQSGTLILENLRETGFSTVEDLHDYSMCYMVVRTLARFHAFSIIRVDSTNVSSLDALTMKNRQYIVDDHLVTNIMKKFRRYVVPLLSSKIQGNLRNMENEFRSAIPLAYSPNDSGFNVIIHGDPRQMTVFFNKTPESGTCKFVDFQNSRLGSPVIDLVHYLMYSVQFEVFQAYGIGVFQFYLQEFTKILEEKDVDGQAVYSWDEMCDDIQKYRWFFVYRLVISVPVHWGRFSTIKSNLSEDFISVLFKQPMYVNIFSSWWQFLNTCVILKVE